MRCYFETIKQAWCSAETSNNWYSVAHSTIQTAEI